MKRFWTEVTIDADRVVRLDGRPVRTPGKLPLALPNDPLAEAVAEEWRTVKGDIDPRAMPLTGLANAAIERIAPSPAPFADTLAAYGESDLLCYRAASPDDLIARQRAAWDPLLGWARTRYDVHFVLVTGVIHQAQPDATVARLREAVRARAPFELAPLAPIVSITGSLIAALALAEEAADADTVWNAAHVDEDWQAELWGHDPLATETRAARRREFDAAVRFLKLARAA